MLAFKGPTRSILTPREKLRRGKQLTYFLELDRDFPKRGMFRDCFAACASIVLAELVELAYESAYDFTSSINEALMSVDYIEEQMRTITPQAVGAGVTNVCIEDYQFDTSDQEAAVATICGVRIVNHIMREHIYYELCNFITKCDNELHSGIKKIDCNVIDDVTVEVTVS